MTRLTPISRAYDMDTTMNIMVCRVCSNSISNNAFIAKEMMFGTREDFNYFQCSSCGTIQIAAVPSNLPDYYPPDYPAHNIVPFEEPNSLEAKLKRFLLKQRTNYVLNNLSAIGFFLHALGNARGRYFPSWLVASKDFLDINSSILDVGCGTGYTLVDLARFGFSTLKGIDPFTENAEYGPVRIIKGDVFSLTETFDFIMLHHSFEHVTNPQQVLVHLATLLKPHGHLLIRIPVADCRAFELYGTDWVQLDPPRHIFLHTQVGMNLMATKARLSLKKLFFDSTEFQFWGSEQYRQGLSLKDQKSVWNNQPYGVFTAHQMNKYREQANTLNLDGMGDQACFYYSRMS